MVFIVQALKFHNLEYDFGEVARSNSVDFGDFGKVARSTSVDFDRLYILLTIFY